MRPDEADAIAADFVLAASPLAFDDPRAPATLDAMRAIVWPYVDALVALGMDKHAAGKLLTRAWLEFVGEQ